MLFNICVMKFVILMLGSLRTSQKGDTVTIYKVKIYIYIYIYYVLNSESVLTYTYVYSYTTIDGK